MLLSEKIFAGLCRPALAALTARTEQELSGPQSASKKLEQRVKELEGLLKDREVRAPSVCRLAIFPGAYISQQVVFRFIV